MFRSSSDRTACKGLTLSSVQQTNGVRKWPVVFLAAVTFILGSWLLSPVVSARLGVSSGRADETKTKQRAGGYDSNRKLDETRLQESYSKLPLSFEPNVGQTDSRVKFLAH